MNKNVDHAIVRAFTEDQVERLTGVTVRQLQNWDKSDFFRPSLASDNRRIPFSRVYTFRDLVSLKVLSALRNDAKISLQHLREVKVKLASLGIPEWSNTTLYVLNKRVVFDNPLTAGKEEVVSGQGVLQIPLQVVARGLEQAVQSLNNRDSNSLGRFSQNRNVANNRIVIAGTRIPVSSIKAFHNAGYSLHDIAKEYPNLTEQDIKAAIDYVDAA